MKTGRFFIQRVNGGCAGMARSPQSPSVHNDRDTRVGRQGRSHGGPRLHSVARGDERDPGWPVYPRDRQGKPQRGEIVAVGTEVTIDGEQRLILRESDVLAVIG
jgi:hypothetical protein